MRMQEQKSSTLTGVWWNYKIRESHWVTLIPLMRMLGAQLRAYANRIAVYFLIYWLPQMKWKNPQRKCFVDTIAVGSLNPLPMLLVCLRSLLPTYLPTYLPTDVRGEAARRRRRAPGLLAQCRYRAVPTRWLALARAVNVRRSSHSKQARQQNQNQTATSVVLLFVESRRRTSLQHWNSGEEQQCWDREREREREAAEKQ